MKTLLLHSLWLIMMFETSNRVPYAQNCDCSFLIIIIIATILLCYQDHLEN